MASPVTIAHQVLFYTFIACSSNLGMSGSVIFDYNTDRIMDYDIWYLPPNKDTYELHMIIPMTEAAYNVTQCTQWLVGIVIYIYQIYDRWVWN